MKHKKILFCLFIFLGLIIIPRNVNAKELNITNIDCGIAGDSVLLETSGNYLLMDTCQNGSDNRVISYLKENNIKNLSIYISHWHFDHFGQLSSIVNDNYFNISKVYLPREDSLTSLYNVTEGDRSSLETQIRTKNQTITNIQNKNIDIKYIWTGDSFKIGDADISIIGPRATEEALLQSDIVKGGYINNKSLVAMVKIDNTRYLTAGDIEKIEEQALINADVDLKADIMKLSHHAIGHTMSANYQIRLSNNSEFMNKVKPKYAFFARPEAFIGDDTDIERISHILQKNNSGNLINLYSSKYNGTTTIKIKDDDITVVPMSNYKTIKVEYKDKDTGEEIAPSKKYNFSYNNLTTDDRVKIPYQLYDYQKEIEGYEYYDATDANNNSIVTQDQEITVGNVYTLKYKKIENNQEVTVPNTLQRNSILITILGLIIIGTGIYVIYKEKNKKIN